MVRGQAVLYRCYDKRGYLLYVGSTLNFIQRIYTHQQERRWAPEIERIELTYFKTKALAEITEKDAIAIEQPIYNTIYRNHSFAKRLYEKQVNPRQTETAA